MKQIDWACDKNVLICFDREPVVQVRVVKPTMNKLERQAVTRYPFINKTPLQVMIYDNKKFKQYNFTIPKNYCWNGSDVPRFFWRIIGSKSEPQYLISSCLHDYLLENKSIIDYNRRLTSLVFKCCLIEAGVSKLKANIMAESVDLYQRFCRWQCDK